MGCLLPLVNGENGLGALGFGFELDYQTLRWGVEETAHRVITDAPTTAGRAASRVSAVSADTGL